MDGVRHRPAEIGIVLVFRGLLEQPEGRFDVLRGGLARREKVEDAVDRFAVGAVGLARGGRGVEVFFKPGAEQPVVVDVPDFAIEGHNVRAGVECRDVAADEPFIHLRRPGAPGGGLGVAEPWSCAKAVPAAVMSSARAMQLRGVMTLSGWWRRGSRFAHLDQKMEFLAFLDVGFAEVRRDDEGIGDWEPLGCTETRRPSEGDHAMELITAPEAVGVAAQRGGEILLDGNSAAVR